MLLIVTSSCHRKGYFSMRKSNSLPSPLFPTSVESGNKAKIEIFGLTIGLSSFSQDPIPKTKPARKKASKEHVVGPKAKGYKCTVCGQPKRGHICGGVNTSTPVKKRKLTEYSVIKEVKD